MKRSSKFLLSVLLSPLMFTSNALNGAEDDESIRCISLTRIDRTEIIDNRNIAFFLKGGDIYVNQLDRACPRLEPNRIISYSTSTGQLCSVDVITVVEDFGFGLRRGASCGLGMFMPADQDYVDMLKGDEEPADVTVKEIEIDE